MDGAAGTFRITHPFHPLFNREFTIATRRHLWGEDRLYYYDDGHTLASIPLTWTSLAPPDPFLVLSAGRSPFRVADFLELARLVSQVRDRRPAWEGG